MKSYSCWGMFPVEQRLFVAPKGFKFSDEDRKQFERPDGIIMLVRD